MGKQLDILPSWPLGLRDGVFIIHASASHLLIYKLLWSVCPQVTRKVFIITGSNKELCFVGCFWLQPQAHLVQTRPFVAGLDIQYNSYTEK